MKPQVSLIAMAFSLAGCAAASADTQSAASVPAAQAPVAAPAANAAPTLEEARAFVARAEKELGDFSVINARAQWVNNTYINDDTDALATHFGTIGTEMGVRYASEAARYASLPGLDFDTKRKLDLLRGALVLAAPAGAAVRRLPHCLKRQLC